MSQLLCGAPTSTGDGCQRSGRPCGIAKHKSYWAAKQKLQAKQPPPAKAQPLQSHSDSEESDNDSVQSGDWSHAQPSHAHSDEEEEEEEEEELSSSDDESPPPPSKASGQSGAGKPKGKVKFASGAVAPWSPPGLVPSSYLHSDEARTTVHHLYTDHLSQPYTHKRECSDDWSLTLPGGELLQRPNHGLAHTVRVAATLPLALRLLLRAKKQSAAMVPARSVYCAQYMLLFAVVGRGNEIGWTAAGFLQEKLQKKGQLDAPHLYDEFKNKGKAILRHHFDHFPPTSLALNKQEQRIWVEALDIGSPALDADNLIGQAMKLAHDADLMRCYPQKQFEENVQLDAEDQLGEDGARTLFEHVRKMNEATGDRCWGWGPVRQYHKALFARCSRDYSALLTALDSVGPQPLSDSMPFLKDKFAAESDSDDDDGASVASMSSSGMESLMDKFEGLKLKGTNDVSVYEQLQLAHSRAITMFRQTPSCVRCFYDDNELDHDIVMNAYTSPRLYEKLNLALCQRRKDDRFLKMYTLLLVKAISDAPHDDIPDTVWRGVGYSDQLLSRYAANLGRTIWLYSFTSTSRSRAVAVKWSQKKTSPALMEIRVPASCRGALADVSSRSMFPEELEILVACNVAFSIDAVDLKQRRIQLTVVDISKAGIGPLPNRQCAPHRAESMDDQWESKIKAKQ